MAEDKKPAKKATSKKESASSKKIAEGSKVKFHYKGTLNTGELFDSSHERQPLEFEVGKGMIIPGLEKEMVGMKKGDKKTIEVKSEDAYGNPRDDLVQEIPKGPIPPDLKLEKGLTLLLRTPEGVPVQAKVVEVKDQTVVLDLNHPLAGKDLKFEVEIVDVE